MRVCIVVPTYNEAENLAELVERVLLAVPTAHILVVDDDSPDGTALKAEELGRSTGAVEVLRRPAKSGLGSAYCDGFRKALDDGFDVIVEMDADLSHDPASLPALLAVVGVAADLVVGSRYIPGGSIPSWSRSRSAISRWGNRYAALVLGLAINDATSGYRAFTAEALRSINFASIRADGYAFQIEMAYRLIRNGGRVVEVPIRFVERTRGESKMSGRIVIEALGLVTGWGVRDRLVRRKIHRAPLTEDLH